MASCKLNFDLGDQSPGWYALAGPAVGIISTCASTITSYGLYEFVYTIPSAVCAAVAGISTVYTIGTTAYAYATYRADRAATIANNADLEAARAQIRADRENEPNNQADENTPPAYASLIREFRIQATAQQGR